MSSASLSGQPAGLGRGRPRRTRPTLRSIRGRLTVRLLLSALLTSAAAGAGLYTYLHIELVEQFDLALLSKARALATLVQVKPDGSGLEFEFSEAAMQEFRASAKLREYFQVWREDGVVFARSPSLPAGVDLVARVPEGENSASYNLRLPDGRTGRAVWLRFQPGPDDKSAPEARRASGPRPTATLVIAIGREELNEPLWHLQATLTLAGAVLLGGTLLLVPLLVRKGLRPLDAVADAATRIDAHSLAYRFDSDSLPDELRPICGRLNDLLARLDGSFQRERRFTADVAHELRTPIAELRSLAEVALKWPPDADSAARHYRSALDIARQMEAIVTALLALVRCQTGQQTITRERMDLAEVASAAWAPYRAAAAERGLTVECDLPAAVYVNGDRAMLVALLGNLFSNAVTYSPRNGRVVCRAQTEHGNVRLTIENPSPGLTADDLPHLCEPFWRKDPSRSDNQHAGLGLSLVKAYVNAQSLAVDFELPEPELFRVTITFPRDAAQVRAIVQN